MKQLELAIIYWKDCCMHGTETKHIDDCREDDFGLMELVSCGIVVNETDEYITLGNTYCEQYDNIRAVVVYPKSGITKIRRIKLRVYKSNVYHNQGGVE